MGSAPLSQKGKGWICHGAATPQRQRGAARWLSQAEFSRCKDRQRDGRTVSCHGGAGVGHGRHSTARGETARPSASPVTPSAFATGAKDGLTRGQRCRRPARPGSTGVRRPQQPPQRPQNGQRGCCAGSRGLGSSCAAAACSELKAAQINPCKRCKETREALSGGFSSSAAPCCKGGRGGGRSWAGDKAQPAPLGAGAVRRTRFQHVVPGAGDKGKRCLAPGCSQPQETTAATTARGCSAPNQI